MSRLRFELTIPLFERTKTVHALNRAATMIGTIFHYYYYYYYGSTALYWALATFPVSGLLERGISPSQGLYLYIEQHKQNKRT
jgi:hypothetical protein